MNTLIHITHEAREKMGGIGAVLEGLLTTRAYQGAVGRTILVGTSDIPLGQPSEHIQTVYYQSGGPENGSAMPGAATVEAFWEIEAVYGVRLLYGRRAVPCPLETRRSSVELLLFDVRGARPEPVNRLKADLWAAYGLASDRFEKDWGFEEWVRVAGPALEAVKALLGEAGDGAPRASGAGEAVLISHEFMGLPTILAARLRAPALKTVYWAHEVPPVRQLIEQDVGERLSFDQALGARSGLADYGARLREAGGYKHALVSRACRSHRIFAVSDRVAQELRLLGPDFEQAPVEIVYNGLPVRPVTLAVRMASRAMLRQYVQVVTGFRPDFVFTHVARPVASKAIDRDLAVLEHLDDILAQRGQTAVLLVLATDGGRRDIGLVRRMEAEYRWPLNHRDGWPDLVKGERPIGQAAEEYNRWARTTRVILVNQFGLSRETCGDRVPEGFKGQDLRQGSDAEFGQSAYEPFGIAQLETLAFGGISVISDVCGCAQLLARVAGDNLPRNILLARYSVPAGALPVPISEGDTRRIEHEVAARLAVELAQRLPTETADFARLLKDGWALAEKMSWQAVCRDYVIPALEHVLGRSTPRARPAARAGAPAAPFEPARGATLEPAAEAAGDPKSHDSRPSGSGLGD